MSPLDDASAQDSGVGRPPDRRARRLAGKALRQAAPRRGLSEWQPPADRDDPVAILQAQAVRRIPELLPIRYGRMRVSPFAFLRGAAAVMAADLAGTPQSGLRVQSCGDCHLGNFGSYATPEGLPVFDINDFDETLPAPFEWDVKRLATSLVLIGRENELREAACRALVDQAMRSYAAEIARLAGFAPLQAWSERIDLLDALDAIPDHRARSRAKSRLHQQLESATEQYGLLDTTQHPPRLRENPPLVVRLPEHDEVTHRAFARYAKTLSPERRMVFERYRLEDVMFKVVGVGSVGTFCAIGLFVSPDGEPLLLQIKEAQDSVLAPFAGPSIYHNAGERVVTGQRIMQAASDLFLGWTHSNADPSGNGAAGRQFYVRRLKDSRLAEIGPQIEADGLPQFAALCGRTLGRGHARSADIARLAGYIGRGRRFARAVTGFALAYADQTERDWRVFNAAIESGQIPAAAA